MYALVLELFKFNPRKVIICALLMLALSVFEGVSIAAILPVLSLSVNLQQHYPSPLLDLLNHLGIHQLAITEALSLFIFLIAFSAILQRQQTCVTQELQQSFNTHLAAKLYQVLARTSWEFWLAKTRSDINHVISHEIGRVGLGCYFLFQLITNFLLLIMYCLLSFMLSVKLTILTLSSASLVFFFFKYLVKKSRLIGLAISNFNQQLMFKLTEYLNGMKELKCYGLEQQQLTCLINSRKLIEQNYLKFTRSQSLLDLIYKITAALFLSGIFYLSLVVLHLSGISLILIVIIFMRTWPRVAQIQTALQSISMTLPAFEQIKQLHAEVSSYVQIIDHDGLKLPWTFMELELQDLNFSYKPEQPSLKQLSFKLRRGEFMACIGKSGSGKSTLADILLGLLTPNSGQILVNQQNLSKIKSQWQSLIAYVPQDVFLFNASIRENLAWSAVARISDSEIWEVLKLVQLYSLINNLPQQLDSRVGDRGIQLSGGERQRLVLARALLRKPQFLILDEATSSLDQSNELLIQQTLELLRGQLTLFVIAHRVSTIKQADQILVLDNGELLGQGSYAELCASFPELVS